MKKLDRNKLMKNIEEIASYDLNENNVFGSSYFVFQDGDTVLKKHFGTSDLNGKIPMGDKAIFRLASMTKPITAIAVMILIDRGLISLSTPASDFLPEFENLHVVSPDGIDLGKTKTAITVMHLLTHTSGFGTHSKTVTMSDDEMATINNTIECFIKAGLDFEPFSTHSYSPFAAFDVLATIIEKVTGQEYEEFLKQEIFIPCNMKDTTFIPSDEQWKRIVDMHDKSDGNNTVRQMKPGCIFEDFPCEHKLAGAGLVSTLDDYIEFSKMLLNRGKTVNKQIVSEETFSLMHKPYVPEEIMPENENWGLGVRVITDESYGSLPVGTFGWSGAYGSHFWIDFENNLCAVFMKNSEVDGGAANASACRFEKAVHDALID